MYVFSVSAQTPQENLEKYWNYRDRFKKYFVKLGANAGEGIMVEQRCSKTDEFGLGCLCDPVNNKAHIKWGDATIWTGYYLAVLATEYALLKENEQETLNTLNEIYYVLNAINRLDLVAEPYLSQLASSPNLNGFFLRDDVPENLYQNIPHWDADYDCMSADARPINSTNPNRFNPGNEESHDQMFSLLLGLTFVNEFVDNLFIKPTAADGGFNIIDETKAITDRLITYLYIRNHP